MWLWGGERGLSEAIESGIVRPGWEAEIESQGLVYNRTEVPGGEVRSYWREGPFYDFSMAEIQRLEGSVAQLFEMCVAAGDHIIENDLFERMRIPPMARPQIRRTWEMEPPSVYARFDLRYDGEGPPKLLEFNADTPTGLVESAVTQWNWHLFTGQGTDQWNALHDKLVAAWKRNLIKWERRTGVRPRVHLAWTSEETSGEDRMTVAYLMDTVVQAGYEAIELIVEDIVLDDGDGRFYDQQGRHLDVVFKLYPWEWLIEDEFGAAVLADVPGPAARPGWSRPTRCCGAPRRCCPCSGSCSAPIRCSAVPAAGLLRRRGAVELAGVRAQAAVGPRGRQRGDRPRRRGRDRAARPLRHRGLRRPGVRAAAELRRRGRAAPPGAGRLGGRRRAGGPGHPGERRADHRQPQLLRAAHHRLRPGAVRAAG